MILKCAISLAVTSYVQIAVFIFDVVRASKGSNESGRIDI